MRARDTGIVTERDVLRALAAHGAEALTRPVGAFASKPLVALPAAGFVYRALSRMSRLNFRHLGVENESGEICGIVTSRDLLRLRAQEATILGDSLDQADDVPALAAAWARLPQAAGALLAEERERTRHRRGDLARAWRAHPARRRAGRAPHERRGAGRAALRLCACACSAPAAAARACSPWIRTTPSCLPKASPAAPPTAGSRGWARIVADILHEVGVPYCDGGVMAQERTMARLARDLARARGRLDHPLQAGRPALGRYLLRSDRRSWRHRAGAGAMARRLRRRARQRRLRQAVGARRRRNAARAQFFRRLAHRERPHRSQAGRACSASCLPRACWRCAIICSSARRRRGWPLPPRSAAASDDLEALARAQGLFLDLIVDAAGCRHAGRPAAEQQGRGQAAHATASADACTKRLAPCAISTRSRATCFFE